jgi:hypothetical protein
MSSPSFFRRFVELRQGDGTVTEYVVLFLELSLHAPSLVASEILRNRKFISGLRASIQQRLWPFLHEPFGTISFLAQRLEESEDACRPRQGFASPRAYRRTSRIRNAQRVCFRCRSPYHFIRHCPYSAGEPVPLSILPPLDFPGTSVPEDVPSTSQQQ